MPAWFRVFAVAILYSLTGAAAGSTHDPNRTATIYVHGFDPDGASHAGVYGDDDELDPEIAGLVGMVGLPTINQPGGAFEPNVVAATTYYGDTPPPYYTPQDVVEVDAVTAQWGGGIPRYALIVAKYARHVMERSGAPQVNFVSASMGSFVTRWLIEMDVEGLASDGAIARWLTLEGVVAGNWAASQNELVDLWELFQTPSIDVEQMHYSWIEQNLHAPRTEADNPLFSSILVGQTASTDDSVYIAALTAAMLAWGEFKPNDGVQSVCDSYFQTVTAQSRFQGLDPTLAFHHVNHFELAGHQGAWAQAATFLTQRRRVTIALTRAQVTHIHEPDDFLWDWTPAEILFESRVYSPQVAAQWGIVDPLTSRHRDGASTPIRLYDFSGQEQFFAHVIYDDLVLEDETVLDVEMWAEELDWDFRYGVTEPLGDDSQSLGGTCVTVPIIGPGTYSFSAPDFNGDLTVQVFEYPFALLGLSGDLDDDGQVGTTDLSILLAAWGPCPSPPAPCPADLDGDGLVSTADLLVLLANWGP